jgi:hypothetical protein
MKKSSKILLGIATIWPLIYMVLFIGFIFLTLFLTGGGGPSQGGGLPGFFLVIFVLHFLTILWIWALIAFYIFNVFKNDRVEKDKKVLWAVVLFMGNVIAMPIYWYLYIWPDHGALSSMPNTPGALNNAEAYNQAAHATANEREKEYVPPPLPPNWRD